MRGVNRFRPRKLPKIPGAPFWRGDWAPTDFEEFFPNIAVFWNKSVAHSDHDFMRTFLTRASIYLTTFVCLVGIVASKPLDSAAVELGGATWHSDLNLAKNMAAREKKPLLVFDLVGRLDEKWC